MILEQAQRLGDLPEQLSEALMTAANCADQIRAIVHSGPNSHTPVRWGRPQDTRLRNPPRRRPLVTSNPGNADAGWIAGE